jgi:diaminopropionate ammonia-lyase
MDGAMALRSGFDWQEGLMTVFNGAKFDVYKNPRASRTVAYDDEGRADILSDAAFEVAKREIALWPCYKETPLR